MKLGTQISIPGIRGVGDLYHILPDLDGRRRVKVWMVPENVSPDRYYISVTPVGATEVLPPSRAKNTLLLADFTQDNGGALTINYINEEVANA